MKTFKQTIEGSRLVQVHINLLTAWTEFHELIQKLLSQCLFDWKSPDMD